MATHNIHCDHYRILVGYSQVAQELSFRLQFLCCAKASKIHVLSWTLHSFDHGIHFWWTLFGLIGKFTPVLALYDPFGVDVPLNFDITHSINPT